MSRRCAGWAASPTVCFEAHVARTTHSHTRLLQTVRTLPPPSTARLPWLEYIKFKKAIDQRSAASPVVMCPSSSLSRKASLFVLPHFRSRFSTVSRARSTRVPWEPRATAQQHLAPRAQRATSVHETKPRVLVPSPFVEKKTKEPPNSPAVFLFCVSPLFFVGLRSLHFVFGLRTKQNKTKTVRTGGGAQPLSALGAGNGVLFLHHQGRGVRGAVFPA